MTEIRLPYRSNPGAYKLYGSPRLVNAFAEVMGDDNKAPYALVPCNGLTALGDDVVGSCRGMVWLEEDNKLYVVFGLFLYSVTAAGVKTQIDLIGGTGPVSIARNDADSTQVVIVTDGRAYLLESNALTLQTYTDDDGETIFTPAGVTQCGGYFVFWQTDGQFWASDLNAATVDALSFATAEGDPDGLTAAFGQVNTLYLIGTSSIEVWVISGGADFPFERMPGAHLRFGSRSPWTVVDFDDSIVMVASDNTVRRVAGYQSEVISSNEVVRLIEAETDKSALYAFTYSRGANKFYCLQGTGWTREYNSATKSWHDRYSGVNDQWKAAYYARAFDMDMFGSRSTGRIYQGIYEAPEEDGNPVIWGFDTEILNAFPNGVSFEAITLDVETGVGLSATSEALAMVSWSDDHGRSWKGNKHMSLGRLGQYLKTLKATGLGSCGRSGRMFRVRISDPVVRAIALIDVEAKPVPL